MINYNMNFCDTYFTDYLQKNAQYNIHPELDEIISNFPTSINKLPNLILYGCSGSGKYTQSLKIIEKYSPNKLKKTNFIKYSYSKNKNQKANEKDVLIFKSSDIHYEIDMYLLGCNSKLYWNEIINEIIGMVKHRKDKNVIILCLNFDKIHQELLDNFHNYFKHLMLGKLCIRYILLCENLSFIPIYTLQLFSVITICKPTQQQCKMICEKNYNDVIGKENIDYDTFSGDNLKELFCENKKITLFEKMYSNIYNVFFNESFDKNIIAVIRNLSYDILVNNIDFFKILQMLIWDFIQISKNIIIFNNYLKNDLPNDLVYFNNNYRSIFHIENILLKIYKLQKNI